MLCSHLLWRNCCGYQRYSGTIPPPLLLLPLPLLLLPPPATQDHDGSHIKGLIMNFLHAFYPSLLQIPGFLVEFITPIIKVRGRVCSWFMLPCVVVRCVQHNATRRGTRGRGVLYMAGWVGGCGWLRMMP